MPYAQGFAFRSTLGFVTDVAPNEFWASALYPTATAQSNNAGWVSSAASPHDRNATFDARIAGDVSAGATTERTFEIDVPAAGSYNIRCAMGDTFAQTGNSLRIYDSDNTTLLATPIPNPTSNSANTYRDATNTQYTAAAWPGSNSSINVTLTGTHIFVRCGTSGGSGGTWVLAYFYIEDAGGGAVTGSGALSADAGSLSSAGVSGSPGTASIQAASSALAGSGTSASAGTASAAAAVATLSASGISASAGTAALASGDASLSGSVFAVGIGDLVAGDATFASAGVSGSVSIAALAAGDAQLSALGANIGIGSLASLAASVSGAGVSLSVGNGQLVCAAAGLAGFEVVISHHVSVRGGRDETIALAGGRDETLSLIGGL